MWDERPIIGMRHAVSRWNRRELWMQAVTDLSVPMSNLRMIHELIEVVLPIIIESMNLSRIGIFSQFTYGFHSGS